MGKMDWLEAQYGGYFIKNIISVQLKLDTLIN